MTTCHLSDWQQKEGLAVNMVTAWGQNNSLHWHPELSRALWQDQTVRAPRHTNYNHCENSLVLPPQADLCRMVNSDLYTEAERTTANGPQTDEASEMERRIRSHFKEQCCLMQSWIYYLFWNIYIYLIYIMYNVKYHMYYVIYKKYLIYLSKILKYFKTYILLYVCVCVCVVK